MVDTYWHSIRRSDGTEGVSTEMIEENMQVVVDAFSTTGFTFNLVEITVTDNDSYYFHSPGDDAELDMKSALRRGGASALNIYSTGLVSSAGGLAFATFPFFYNAAVAISAPPS